MPVNSLIRITVAYADDNFKPVLLNQEWFLNKTNMKEKQNLSKEICSYNHNHNINRLKPSDNCVIE
jgi:hypothetical protein